MDNVNDLAFQLILFAGNGRSYAMEAIQEAKKGNFEKAEELIKKAGEEIGQAHKFQTELIHQEAQGQPVAVNILLVHAQDHLMTSMVVRDLANEIIELYRSR
ncbi:MAG: cellobiose system component [Candidatus Petromonas sp.]|nr:cellobiose system component [Candidatus Petromonas sp.]